jgi:hypothetical protein
VAGAVAVDVAGPATEAPDALVAVVALVVIGIVAGSAVDASAAAGDEAGGAMTASNERVWAGAGALAAGRWCAKRAGVR